jgi:hypothetical protein
VAPASASGGSSWGSALGQLLRSIPRVVGVVVVEVEVRCVGLESGDAPPTPCPHPLKKKKTPAVAIMAMIQRRVILSTFYVIHPTAWKVNSANFAGSALSEVRAKLESVAECLWWNGVRTRLDRADWKGGS